MTAAQAIALVSGLTALLIAGGHFLADLTGAMDKIRKTPIAQQGAPVPPPQQPGAPSAS